MKGKDVFTMYARKVNKIDGNKYFIYLNRKPVITPAEYGMFLQKGKRR